MGKLEVKFPVYSKLLKLYPADYRHRYGRQMLQILDDMLADKNKTKSGVWLRTSVDLPFSILRQQLSYMVGTIKNDTPNYIKRTGFASALLLLPFFIFLSLDAVTSHSLYSGWFWKPWVVGTWLIIMPATAFIISTSVFVYWLNHRKQSFWKSVFDLRHNWPLTVATVLSIGIIILAFGHDSVHCVVNNPVKEIRDWHTTWRCIQQG